MQLLSVAVFVGSLVIGVRGRVNYDGYRVFRVSTHHDADAIQDQIKTFTTIPFNLDVSEHLDVAVAPKDVAAFEALNLDTEILHEDLGADIIDESASTFSTGMCLILLPKSSVSSLLTHSR